MEDTLVTSSKVFSKDDISKLKPRPKITQLEISCDKLEYLNKKLQDSKILPYEKQELITKITGGICSICKELRRE
jgi:hypothetical protein